MSRIPVRLPAPRKFGNVRTDGFDSRKEAAAFHNLQLLERAGVITDLEADKKKLRYPLTVNGVLICTYVADFRYRLVDGGEVVVEDCKGVRTPVYKLKKKLMKALCQIEIRET